MASNKEFTHFFSRNQLEIAREMKEIHNLTNTEIAAKTGLSIEIVERVMNPDTDDKVTDLLP